MARFFSAKGTAVTATRSPELPVPRVGAEPVPAPAVACSSYHPGHQMHYIQQGQALRSRSERAQSVLVDEHRVVVVLESGAQLDWRNHDPERLRAMLDRFPASRVAYPRFHSLRVGPYWFNCAPLGQFSPCPDPA